MKCLNIFQTSVEKIEVSLKSDKNNRCFTWRPIQIFGSVSLISFSNEIFQTKVVQKIKPRFVFNNFFFKSWKNVVDSRRGQMTIWRMRIASWIPNATNTPIICNTYCFSTATMVARPTLMLRYTYIAILVIWSRYRRRSLTSGSFSWCFPIKTPYTLPISSSLVWSPEEFLMMTKSRKLSRICALFKAYSREPAWKAIGDRLQRPHYLSRVDHERKIRSRRQRTDIGNYFFVNRTIQHWNQLPADVLGTLPCKPIIFKKRVRKLIIVVS